ncbi:MAG TPA: transcriptional regulator BetI [Mesorhizobium sp.]|jgi:TetR/AcrR family transcriptional repressor of bet genes
MPKLGMQPIRRRALIDAAISAIGARGSLDVTMTDIAGRAGVSTALAHHYFGAKDELLAATMWHLLADLGLELRRKLQAADSPRERISTVVAVSFSVGQFSPEVVATWLAFYVEAQRSPTLRRLLRIYVHRMRSNLLSAFARLMPRQDAEQAAEAVAALIDGFYIRRALRDGLPNPFSAVAIIEDYVDAKLATKALS